MGWTGPNKIISRKYFVSKSTIKLSNWGVEAIKFIKNISSKYRKRPEYNIKRQRFQLEKKFRIATKLGSKLN